MRRPRVAAAVAVLLAAGLLAACEGDALARPDPDGAGSAGDGTVILEEGFESGTLSFWHDGVDPARHQIIVDPAHVRTGQRALRITYPAGSDGGYLSHFFMPGYDSVHVSMHVKFEAAWQDGTKLLALYGSSVNDRWSGHGKAGVCPNGRDFFNAMLVTAGGGAEGPGDVNFYTYFPGMQPSGSNCWGNHSGPGTRYFLPLALTRGTWHHLELWVRANTPGQADGAMQIRVDEVLRAEWTGLRFRDTPDLRLNSVQISANMTAPRTQHLYIDDLVVRADAPAPSR